MFKHISSFQSSAVSDLESIDDIASESIAAAIFLVSPVLRMSFAGVLSIKEWTNGGSSNSNHAAAGLQLVGPAWRLCHATR